MRNTVRTTRARCQLRASLVRSQHLDTVLCDEQRMLELHAPAVVDCGNGPRIIPQEYLRRRQMPVRARDVRGTATRAHTLLLPSVIIGSMVNVIPGTIVPVVASWFRKCNTYGRVWNAFPMP
jgi:hypothetical protein